jgi:DNA-binding HxlR family transcriptional regulator
MLGRTYENEACSAARALEIAGERWSLLILRNALFAGMTRFTDFQQSLEIAPNILTKRLETFVKEGLMTTSKGESEHLEYILTSKGMDFKPVIIALTEWGDKWAATDGPPIIFQHEGCGGRIVQPLFCETCESTAKVNHIVAKITKAMAVYKKKISQRRGEKRE